MHYPCKSATLVAFAVLLSAGPAFAQTSTTEATAEAKAVAPAAYVYAQTSSGVVAYAATASGELTLVKGSPFSVAGQMEGINGKYLIAVGTTNLRTYPITSTGTIGKQASIIDTANFGGSECGATGGEPAELDHTGQYFYVELDENAVNCTAWQSYKISSDGAFTFLGAAYGTEGFQGGTFSVNISAISSNDDFAYGFIGTQYAPIFSAFRKGSDGALSTNSEFSEVDPRPNPKPSNSDNNYFPIAMAADPAGHMAVLMEEAFCLCGETPNPQLASYTINPTTGKIISTNTYLNMPTDQTSSSIMRMSPSGKILALGGAGITLFHFNGAAPITDYKSILPAVGIDSMGWDQNNHLYAISNSTEKLYVYTVTPTSATEVAGSPYHLSSPYGLKGLIVVPKL
jgi:hypothetical protein